MLTRKQITTLFELLNDHLAKQGEMGEVGIVGGAVMCLVYDVRKSTKDVDAIFKPATLIRKLAARVAEDFGVQSDWLNDAAKGFLVDGFERHEIMNLSHLRVWAPEPKYMLAMKCLSARWDTFDQKDVVFLVRLLKLKEPKEVFDIIESYYPKNRIPPKTQFFIEELMSSPEKKKRKKK